MSEKTYSEHSCISLEVAAAIVNLDPRTLKPYLESSEIKTKWVGKRRKILYGSLIAWLNSDKTADELAKSFLKNEKKVA